MKKQRTVIISILLIAVGVVMIMFTINDYRDEVKSNFDDGLWDSVSTIDYQISNYFERFNEDLEYSATRQGFIYAEEQWVKYGSTSLMKERILSSSISNRPHFRTLLAIKDGNIELSYDDDTSYVIGRELTDGISLATNDSGETFLAFIYESSDTLEYAGIYDLKSMYVDLVEKIAGDNNEVRLMDEQGEVVLQVKTDSEGIEAIENSEKSGNDTVVDYERASEDDKTEEIRMAIRPLKLTENKVFSVAVASNYDKTASMVNMVTTKLFIYMMIAVIGLIMLIMLFLRNRQRIAEADEELRELKEKNAAMEELNKKTQELAHHQRLETIGTLTSSIAHEFNNLLTPIMGYSMMTLESVPDDSEIYDDILEIYNASVKAKDIISRLSELSRKNTEVIFTPLSPNMLVNKVMNVAAPALPKNVDINRNLNVPGIRIFGNEIQLSQMLLNLIINAFQSTEINGGEITIATEDMGDEILLILKDNGQGIPEDVIDNIFEPFFTTKETGKGTGLGLAIVAQAVEDHNGHIDVESEEGIGTTFTVHIPAYTPEKDEDSVILYE